jgi:hypothetical protein
VTGRCAICGERIEEGRYCDDCLDLAQLDPAASISVPAVLLRRLKRTHALEGGLIDNLVRLVDGQQRSGRR